MAPCEKPSTNTVLQGTEVFCCRCTAEDIRHQALLVRVPQKSFQTQKLGKTSREYHEKGVRELFLLPCCAK